MSKFCGNCGAEMNDAAAVCSNCGTPFVDPAAQPVKAFVSPEKAKKRKRIMTISFSSVAAVLIAVIIIGIVISNNSCNGLIKKTMKAFMKDDIDTLMSISSGFSLKEDDAEGIMERTVDEYFSLFKDEVGSDYKLSYKVNSTNTLPSSEYKSLCEKAEEEFPNSGIKIDEVVSAEVTVTAKGSKSTKDFKLIILVTRENGKWKLDGIVNAQEDE